jgi:hypothetical protein
MIRLSTPRRTEKNRKEQVRTPYALDKALAPVYGYKYLVLAFFA